MSLSDFVSFILKQTSCLSRDTNLLINLRSWLTTCHIKGILLYTRWMNFACYNRESFLKSELLDIRRILAGKSELNNAKRHSGSETT